MHNRQYLLSIGSSFHDELFNLIVLLSDSSGPTQVDVCISETLKGNEEILCWVSRAYGTWVIPLSSLYVVSTIDYLTDSIMFWLQHNEAIGNYLWSHLSNFMEVIHHLNKGKRSTVVYDTIVTVMHVEYIYRSSWLLMITYSCRVAGKFIMRQKIMCTCRSLVVCHCCGVYARSHGHARP